MNIIQSSKKALPFAAAALLFFYAPACRADIVVTDAWARATPEHAENGALYFSITNTGKKNELLTDIDTTISNMAMVHETVKRMVDGKERVHMKMLTSLVLPAGKTITFAPGGYHVMLTQLRGPLVEGESFQATLRFAYNPPVSVDVDIAGVGADKPGSDKPEPDK